MPKKIKRINCEASGCEVADISVKKYDDKYYCPKHAPKPKGRTIRLDISKQTVLKEAKPNLSSADRYENQGAE